MRPCMQPDTRYLTTLHPQLQAWFPFIARAHPLIMRACLFLAFWAVSDANRAALYRVHPDCARQCSCDALSGTAMDTPIHRPMGWPASATPIDSWEGACDALRVHAQNRRVQAQSKILFSGASAFEQITASKNWQETPGQTHNSGSQTAAQPPTQSRRFFVRGDTPFESLRP